MTIRCAELKILIAIGCGEQLFNSAKSKNSEFLTKNIKFIN